MIGRRKPLSEGYRGLSDIIFKGDYENAFDF